jgi:hypothetical protein
MSADEAKTIARKEWDKLTPWEQRERFKEGFRPVDDPPAIKSYPAESKMIDRKAWDQLTPWGQREKYGEGFKPVD